mmetsp:Transcript_68875/g.128571  ORF Transcript_68875/g.128571 Transcript_68875/m.128571 type:complete len:253 (+) Transcript_68875:85-843(+)
MGSTACRTCCQHTELIPGRPTFVSTQPSSNNPDAALLSAGEVAEPFTGGPAGDCIFDQVLPMNMEVHLSPGIQSSEDADCINESPDVQERSKAPLRTVVGSPRNIARRRVAEESCFSLCNTNAHHHRDHRIEPIEAVVSDTKATTSKSGGTGGSCGWEAAKTDHPAAKNLLHRLQTPGIRLQVFDYNGWQDVAAGDAQQCCHHLKTGGTRFAILSSTGMYIVDFTNLDGLFWMNLQNGQLSRLRLLQLDEMN